MRQKGTGVAGGGLVARQIGYEKLESASATSPTTKKYQGMTFHRPGSQNPRKGGPGKEKR